MKTARLEDRVGKVEDLGRVFLENHEFRFSKLSDDGSGKANIHPQNGAVVEGVLFRLSEAQICKLDAVEKGYCRVTRKVKTQEATDLWAETYVAKSDCIKDGLKPTAEYRDLLVQGAGELKHKLSDSYIKFLESANRRLKS